MALGRRNVRLPRDAAPVDETLRGRTPAPVPGMASTRPARRHGHRCAISPGKSFAMINALIFVRVFDLTQSTPTFFGIEAFGVLNIL
ncbi:hypothetical protein [Azospirillum palustre]